jgi:hypothetical protein
MGLVIHAYHGSPNKFDEFNFDHVGEVGGTDGAGIGLYFTELEAEAFVYGENIYQVILTLKNSIHNEKVTLNCNELTTLLINLQYGSDFNYSQGFPEAKMKASNLLNLFKSDTEIIENLLIYSKDINKMMKCLSDMGYTHTIDLKESDDRLSTHYIVYDKNAIQIIEKYNLDTRRK